MTKNLVLQGLFFFIIFHLISWFRESSLLDTDGTVQTPKVTLTQFNGEPVDIEQYKGKPVLYYFWAPWCTICKVSMPNLQDFYDDNNNKIEVVAIALSYQTEQEVMAYIEQQQYQFDAFLGDMTTAEAFKIKGFPTYYLADKDGRLVAKSMGYTSELGMKIRSLIL